VGGFGESPWLFQRLRSRLAGLGLSLSRPDVPTCAFRQKVPPSRLTHPQEQSSGPGSRCILPGCNSDQQGVTIQIRDRSERSLQSVRPSTCRTFVPGHLHGGWGQVVAERVLDDTRRGVFADLPAHAKLLPNVRESASPRWRNSGRHFLVSRHHDKLSTELTSLSKLTEGTPGIRGGSTVNLVTEFMVEHVSIFSRYLPRFILRPLCRYRGYLQAAKTKNKKPTGQPP